MIGRRRHDDLPANVTLGYSLSLGTGFRLMSFALGYTWATLGYSLSLGTVFTLLRWHWSTLRSMRLSGIHIGYTSSLWRISFFIGSTLAHLCLEFILGFFTFVHVHLGYVELLERGYTLAIRCLCDHWLWYRSGLTGRPSRRRSRR